MQNTRLNDDQVQASTMRDVRDAIALALDGAMPPTDHETVAGYRAAVVPLSAMMPQPLHRLRQLAATGRVAATARFDNTHRLLGALGVASIATRAIPENDTWPGVVFVGCLGTGNQSNSQLMERLLARGAIIVSSDTSAGLPVIANELNIATARPGDRARVSVGPELANLLAVDSPWGRLVAGMHPALRLAPGHLPLARQQQDTTRVIARNAMTDEPLVVVARVAGGQAVHSVAHWWQETQPDSTELGRRALASVPAFEALGLEHRDARVGGFSAASVMLACLLAGLDVALDRVGWRASFGSLTSTEGGQIGSST